MEIFKQTNKRQIIALAMILLLGLLSTQGFLETSPFIKSHTSIKYGIYFLWLLLVAVTGLWGWKHYPQKWVLTIWILAYSLAIIVLFSLGLVDLWLGPLPLYYKKDISHFRMFFLSPALFVLLYLLSVFSKNKTQH